MKGPSEQRNGLGFHVLRLECLEPRCTPSAVVAIIHALPDLHNETAAEFGPAVPGAVFDKRVSASARAAAAQPDLAATRFTFQVLADEGHANGPLPVNVSFDATVTVRNLGNAKAGSFYVSLYASNDNYISSSDVSLGRARVSSLNAGSSTTVQVRLTLPSSLPSSFKGQVWLGGIVDSTGAVRESNENNNRNRGDGLDRRSVQLYDPVGPVTAITGFVSSRDAENYLRNHGFSRVLVPQEGSGWVKWLCLGST
jgi:hypothetical protein